MNVSEHIHRQAKELGMEALSNMDELCEEHMRGLGFHPVADDAKGTVIYNKFERLVIEHAEEQGFEWDELDVTVQTELWEEVRESFDEGYYQPSEQIQCIKCLNNGDIPIRVSDPDAVSAENILDGKSRSGHVGRDEGMDEWR